MNTGNSAIVWLCVLGCALLWGCSSKPLVKEFNPPQKSYLLTTKYFLKFDGPEELVYSTEEVVYLPPNPEAHAEAVEKLSAIRSKPENWPQFLIKKTEQAKGVRVTIEIMELQYP